MFSAMGSRELCVRDRQHKLQMYSYTAGSSDMGLSKM